MSKCKTIAISSVHLTVKQILTECSNIQKEREETPYSSPPPLSQIQYNVQFIRLS